MSGIVAQNLNKHTGLIKAPGGGGAWNFISKTTISSDATISFTSGLDSTYREYMFYFVDIHPATDNTVFQFNGSDDDSSHSYDVTKTTTFHEAYQGEDDSAQATQYKTGLDLAQSTGFQPLSGDCGNDNDQGLSGELWLFNPSDTTFVKHFLVKINFAHYANYTVVNYPAGYFNTTADITAIQFKYSTGNIDSGTFKLYGIKDS